MVKVADLPSFDMAESLKTEEDIVMYLNIVLEENDPAELAHALGVIAKARGMTQIAKEAGIGVRHSTKSYVRIKHHVLIRLIV